MDVRRSSHRSDGGVPWLGCVDIATQGDEGGIGVVIPLSDHGWNLIEIFLSIGHFYNFLRSFSLNLAKLAIFLWGTYMFGVCLPKDILDCVLFVQDVLFF